MRCFWVSQRCEQKLENSYEATISLVFIIVSLKLKNIAYEGIKQNPGKMQEVWLLLQGWMDDMFWTAANFAGVLRSYWRKDLR